MRLQFPPYAVLVSVPPKESDMPGLGTTADGATIIPLLPSSRNVTISRYLKLSGQKKKETVVATAHPYHLLFATTYHGVQCRTLPKIVLCVGWPSQPALTYNAFYVGISRVRTGEDIRLLQMPSVLAQGEVVARLRSLVPKATLVQYMLGHKTAKQTWDYLTAMYKKVGIAYGKNASDKTTLQGSTVVKTYTCRRGGCNETFSSDVGRTRHEKVCTHQGSVEGQFQCKYLCGLSWPKESNCKKHEAHCKKRPREQEVTPTELKSTTVHAVDAPLASTINARPTDVPVPIPRRDPRAVGHMPTIEEEEEIQVNANLNALRLVMPPQEAERHGKRRKQ